MDSKNFSSLFDDTLFVYNTFKGIVSNLNKTEDFEAFINTTSDNPFVDIYMLVVKELPIEARVMLSHNEKKVFDIEIDVREKDAVENELFYMSPLSLEFPDVEAMIHFLNNLNHLIAYGLSKIEKSSFSDNEEGMFESEQMFKDVLVSFHESFLPIPHYKEILKKFISESNTKLDNDSKIFAHEILNEGKAFISLESNNGNKLLLSFTKDPSVIYLNLNGELESIMCGETPVSDVLHLVFDLFANLKGIEKESNNNNLSKKLNENYFIQEINSINQFLKSLDHADVENINLLDAFKLFEIFQQRTDSIVHNFRFSSNNIWFEVDKFAFKFELHTNSVTVSVFNVKYSSIDHEENLLFSETYHFQNVTDQNSFQFDEFIPLFVSLLKKNF